MKGTDITIPGDAAHGDPDSPGYASLPAGATKAMVVIHEIFGRQPEIDRVVDRFASQGYAAVAPDLFAHGRLACMYSVMRAMQTGDEVAAVRLAHRARQWLHEKTSIPTERIGLIGFCFGGGFALLAGPGWAAVSTNYGVVPPAERMRGIGPVIGCYGGRDVLFRAEGDKLRRRLAKVGVTSEILTYPTAGHSLLTDGDHPVGAALMWPLMHIRYDAKIAEEAWSEIIAFFDRHLATTPAA